jgi:hypothetical protein
MRIRKRVLIGPIYSFNTVSKRKQQRFLLIRNPLLRMDFERFLHWFEMFKSRFRTEKFFSGSNKSAFL